MNKQKRAAQNTKNSEKEPDIREYGIVLLLIKFYRRFISPYKQPCCRFTPSCSQYAIDAIREWGVLFGISLSIWRVLRCNPFGKGGYDPVPKNPFKCSKKELNGTKNPDNN